MDAAIKYSQIMIALTVIRGFSQDSSMSSFHQPEPL
jgi:hypothetical protein